MWFGLFRWYYFILFSLSFIWLFSIIIGRTPDDAFILAIVAHLCCFSLRFIVANFNKKNLKLFAIELVSDLMGEQVIIIHIEITLDTKDL